MKSKIVDIFLIVLIIIILSILYAISCVQEREFCIQPEDANYRCDNDTEMRYQPECYYKCVRCNGEYYEEMDCDDFSTEKE